jgi:hypothetical protein
MQFQVFAVRLSTSLPAPFEPSCEDKVPFKTFLDLVHTLLVPLALLRLVKPEAVVDSSWSANIPNLGTTASLRVLGTISSMRLGPAIAGMS